MQQQQQKRLPLRICRPDELLAPTNAHWLYTRSFFTFCRRSTTQHFNNSLCTLTGTKNTLLLTLGELCKNYKNVHYLHTHTSLEQVITCFLKQIKVKPGTWGGPDEISLIVKTFKINIQEHTPDPDSSSKQAKSNLTEPKTSFLFLLSISSRIIPRLKRWYHQMKILISETPNYLS